MKKQIVKGGAFALLLGLSFFTGSILPPELITSILSLLQ